MLSRGPLWKNIGKEGACRSPESSLSSGRPIKAFHIMFEDDPVSESEVRQAARGSLLKRSSSIREELDASPMIIDDADRENNEKVLEVISFDSHEHARLASINHVLKSITRIDHKERTNQPSLGPRARSALAAALAGARQLRQEMDGYKFYLLSALSEWEVQAIKNFKVMGDRIDACLALRAPPAPAEAERALLQQEVTMLNRSLALEREAREVLRRENTDLEEKLRRAERGQSEQRLKTGSELAQLEELRSRMKRLEVELGEARTEAETQTAKTVKLRQIIREREAAIAAQHEDTAQLDKRLKELKVALEESTSRERRAELEAKAYRERAEADREAAEKEAGKARAETGKLKGLLKVSEEQLSQCEDYIARLNSGAREQQAEMTRLQERVRASEAQYLQRLRECDQYLAELEAATREMASAQRHKHEQLDAQAAQLTLATEQLHNQAIELRAREAELEEQRRDYDHKAATLARREDGLKAEYRMAVEGQQAAKDKWYTRYYAMLSPERARNEPPRDTLSHLAPPRPSLTRRDTDRDTRSPLRDRLFKAKSERNLNLLSPRSDVPSLPRELPSLSRVGSAGVRQERSEAQRDLASLGSRINTLRRQLTQELGQMGIKP